MFSEDGENGEDVLISISDSELLLFNKYLMR